MKELLAVRLTLRIAFGFVLVASILRRPTDHRARVIVTMSLTGGAVAGVTVSVPVRLTPKAVAMMVTTVGEVTAFVVTGNAPLDWPPDTTVSAGTVTIVGLLLNSVTTAPSVAEPNLTVPVDGLPPATVAGMNETEERTGVGGGVTTPPLAPAVEVEITLQYTTRRAARSAKRWNRERVDRGGEPRRACMTPPCVER